ncbi:MAG: hypothetical protein P8Y64_07270 [Gammaproteobacteria bacterium]
MKTILNVMFLLLLSCLPGALFAQTQATGSTRGKAVILTFQEQEPGTTTYTTRVIVTARYLRMDQGHDNGDFLLFDRKTGEIQSVNHEDDTVLRIYRHPIKAKPAIPFKTGVKTERDPKAPSLDGKRPTLVTFTANGTACYHVVAVKGFLDDARKGMQALKQTLAGEAALNLARRPASMQHACSLANSIFAAADHLAYGFPVQEWDNKGYRRSLVDYRRDVPVKPSWFVISDKLHPYSIHDKAGNFTPVM